VEGREIPDSSAGGHRAQTLKSFLLSLKGETAKRRSVSRFASFSNFALSAAVYPSPRIRKSTLSAESPVFWISRSAPGGGGLEVSMKMSLGSRRTVQISRN